MAVTSAVQFTVTGTGQFPLDMLRYDACYPAGPDDVFKIGIDRFSDPDIDADGRPVARSVTLTHVCPPGGSHWEPTDARWRSFGWEITSRLRRIS